MVGLIPAACTAPVAPALAVISPELNPEQQSDAAPPVNVAQARGVAPIVVSTLNSQPAIASAAERVRSRFASVDEERSGYYPQVSAGLASNLIGTGRATPQFRLTGSQMLYDFGRTGRGVSRQVLLAQQAHLEFLEAVDEDLAEMLRLLIEYDSQTRQIDLSRGRLARMQELRSLIENRTIEGVTTGNSLVEAERRVQTAETLVLRTDLALGSSRRAIEAETGMAIGAGGTGIDLGRLSCGAKTFDATRVTSVRLAQIDLAVAQLDLETAETARLPTVALEAATNRNLSDLSASGDVGLSISVDTAVFRGGAFHSRNVAAARTVAAAEATVKSESQSAKLSFENAADAERSQRVLADALRDQSDLLDETRTLYLQQFIELGTKTLDDVLDVEEEYHQNLLDIEIARQDTAMEQINCLVAQGLPRRFAGVEDALLYGLALSP